MIVVSMLSHADFGANDHRDDALHFIPSMALASATLFASNSNDDIFINKKAMITELFELQMNFLVSYWSTGVSVNTIGQ